MPKTRERIAPDRGTLWQRGKLRAKDAWMRGDVLQNVHRLSMYSSGIATAMIAHPDPRVAHAGAYILSASVPATIGTGVASWRQRLKFRQSPWNSRNIDRVVKTENPEYLRRLDYAYVKRYAIDPDRVEKELEVTPTGAAYTFASARRLRLAPNSPYIIEKHESPDFAKFLEPLLRLKLNQMANGNKTSEIYKRHFPKGSAGRIRKITNSELPREYRELVPPRLLDEEPQNEAEAVALTLLAGSIARARQRNFKNGNH
jgi:hypothetical protein